MHNEEGKGRERARKKKTEKSRLDAKTGTKETTRVIILLLKKLSGMGFKGSMAIEGSTKFYRKPISMNLH